MGAEFWAPHRRDAFRQEFVVDALVDVAILERPAQRRAEDIFRLSFEIHGGMDRAADVGEPDFGVVSLSASDEPIGS